MADESNNPDQGNTPHPEYPSLPLGQGYDKCLDAIPPEQAKRLFLDPQTNPRDILTAEQQRAFFGGSLDETEPVESEQEEYVRKKLLPWAAIQTVKGKFGKGWTRHLELLEDEEVCNDPRFAQHSHNEILCVIKAQMEQLELLTEGKLKAFLLQKCDPQLSPAQANNMTLEELARILREECRRLEDQPERNSRADAGQARKKRAGRPQQGENGKDDLVIGALVKHHQWRPGGSVGKDDPAKTEALAKLASGKHVQVSPSTVSRFFKKKFPGRGYKGYEAACSLREIGRKLSRWQGDDTEHVASLDDEEQDPRDKKSGRRVSKHGHHEND